MKASVFQTIDQITKVLGVLMGAATILVLLVGIFPSSHISGAIDRVQAPEIPLALLVNQDRCWTGGEAALAAIPTAAVIRFRETGETVYTNDRELVDEALNHVLSVLGAGKKSDILETVALCI